MKSRAYGIIQTEPAPRPVETLDNFSFVLDTTRDDFIDWLYNVTDWNPDPAMKQKIKKSAAAWGTDRRVSKIFAKANDIQSRDKSSMLLSFGNDSHYPGAEIYFHLLPVDDKRVQITASFASRNGLEVFREALQTIAQTYRESADVITAYLCGERPAPTVEADEGKAATYEDTTGWDNTLIQMWNDGYTRDEISKRVHVSHDRVTNRITELRNKFGVEIIPYNKERKKRLIKKS